MAVTNFEKAAFWPRPRDAVCLLRHIPRAGHERHAFFLLHEGLARLGDAQVAGLAIPRAGRVRIAFALVLEGPALACRFCLFTCWMIHHDSAVHCREEQREGQVRERRGQGGSERTASRYMYLEIQVRRETDLRALERELIIRCGRLASLCAWMQR